MSSTVKSNGNLVSTCNYLVVWCPTYRRQVSSKGMDPRRKEISHPTAPEFQASEIEWEGMSDPGHLLCAVDPPFGLQCLVRYRKGGSARLLRQAFPWLRFRLPRLWTHLYFAATLGGAPLAVSKQSSENQKGV